jgi:hypothetical protein
MGPGQQHAILFLPLGWISEGAHKGIKISASKERVKPIASTGGIIDNVSGERLHP